MPSRIKFVGRGGGAAPCWGQPVKTYLGRIGDLDVFCIAFKNDGEGMLRGYVIQRGLEVLHIVLSEAEAWIWARSCLESRDARHPSCEPDAMFAILHLLGTFVASLLKSRRRLEVENLFLRHQLNIALRQRPPRPRLRSSDRALLVWMTRLWPSLLGLARVVEPATILRWHRAGFRTYWRWKSRGRAGRPKIDRELRDLIRRMNVENPCGEPRASMVNC